MYDPEDPEEYKSRKLEFILMAVFSFIIGFTIGYVYF